jgi:predicted nucleic acid-binding protein
MSVLLAAKQRGAIASLREEINALAALGFRANPQLVAAVLQRAGE